MTASRLRVYFFPSQLLRTDDQCPSNRWGCSIGHHVLDERLCDSTWTWKLDSTALPIYLDPILFCFLVAFPNDIKIRW